MSTTTTITKACAECIHWNSGVSGDGECRRHAPQLISFEVDDDVKVESRFPTTSQDDWCGDFEKK
ncbi:hypothetical protein ACFQY0_14195 [Haloferula chungangensis]|uniref:Benzylsuccinate synthase n=1 Tax=Haloferula chungangensis TaxID=1048331 RepID=A0ABW2LB11_9BACT